MLSCDWCFQKEVRKRGDDLSARINISRARKIGSCKPRASAETAAEPAWNGHVDLYWIIFNGRLKARKSGRSSREQPPTLEMIVAAKSVARSAEAIDPNRVGAHGRKTYLHAG